jgi:cysteinyl-tRNA synthetase
MQWESPWGMGYPGWHIECSAMSQKYLGAHFDIHSGGVDHIPIHHENEIAQNEALSGEKSVNYWLHGEFMLVDGGKMSKSLGNVYTISELEEKGYSPLDFRFFCLNAHYRKRLNFTFEALTAAKVSRERLLLGIYQHKIAKSVKTDSEILNNYKQQFIDAINDDINIPLALGVLFSMVKEPKSIDIYNLLLEFDTVLGLSLSKAKATSDDIAPKYGEEVALLIKQRAQAKKDKNFALSDEIRDRINALGYSIIDTREGVRITKI